MNILEAVFRDLFLGCCFGPDESDDNVVALAELPEELVAQSTGSPCDDVYYHCCKGGDARSEVNL